MIVVAASKAASECDDGATVLLDGVPQGPVAGAVDGGGDLAAERRRRRGDYDGAGKAQRERGGSVQGTAKLWHGEQASRNE